MGVAGSGKSTVGRILAASLGWRFVDADDFHPPANIARMSAGYPLTDADRAPWLSALHDFIQTRIDTTERIVLACSALKAVYRRQLMPDPLHVGLVYLKGSAELLASRLGNRSGHFAPPTLLISQLAALEEPSDALVLDISASPEQLAVAIRQHYQL